MPTSHVLEKAKITFIPIMELKPYKNNARKHSAKQIQQIANSIKEFGFMSPVLVNSDRQIMAGHGRVEAAKKLGMKEVPVISTNHLSEDQRRAFIIADNKIAQNAEWNNDLLSIELKYLNTVTDFDIEITGFETPEIDLITDMDEVEEDDEVTAPEIDKPSITKRGDVWDLGEHRLICGDSTLSDTFTELLGKERAHMIFTDPPYNVPIDGHVCGLGSVKHKEFAMASGEMTEVQFQAFLYLVCKHMLEFSRDGSLHYICMDWRHIYELLAAAKRLYRELKNICVWNKDNGGMGALYRSKHEFVTVFKHGTKPHVNNIELGKHGRYRTNVWDYAGVNSFGKNRSDLKLHPTVKPVTMVADAIKDCTKHGHIVLDPFAGSGTTIIAAEKTGRIARCIEFDPHYCDVIIRRWQKITGSEAINFDTLQSFDETANVKESHHV